MRLHRFPRTFLFLISYSLFLISCGPGKYISKQSRNLLSDSNLSSAHVGISIFDPENNKYIYRHQSDKYFIPASNTKIVTCYAAMKYLGDSIPALRYFIDDTLTVFKGTGDPTLLHPDFRSQPALNFLRRQPAIAITGSVPLVERWGYGWSIGDINASYMPERSELPVYGNVLRIYRSGDSLKTMPPRFRQQVTLDQNKNWMIDFERTSLNVNFFNSIASSSSFRYREVPFVTGSYMSAWALLTDTLHKNIYGYHGTTPATWNTLYSHPTDSMLKPMMHRSDNFFAEQTLLMVSDKLLHVMSDNRVIDTLLKTDLKDLPQKPRWVDGSGLSRYNLFSPDDFVKVLGKIKNEFDWNRVTAIFPSGGEGTLGNYYLQLKDHIFAKTGTLSNNIALSGFLVTRDNRTLIFSVLVNNHTGNTTQIRKAVEKLLMLVAEKY